MRSCVQVISRRGRFFVVINWLCFGSVLVSSFSANFLYTPFYETVPLEAPEFLVGADWPILFVGIFLFNLFLSGFVVVTLPGLVFFPLSAVVLVVRGVLWGFLLNQLPTSGFLLALPTLVLEGEGYVLAGVAGVSLGLSWLRPGWVYGGEGLSRLDSLKRALKDCGRIYFLVALFLLAAAIVETATIVYLPPQV